MAKKSHSIIRRLTKRDVAPFASIAANAYPGMKILRPEEIKKLAEQLWRVDRSDPAVKLYGLFRDGRLCGGMRYFDFVMTMLSTPIPVGGGGTLAVDLTRKKQHVAKELIEHWLRHYLDRETSMLALYAFRPDFYRDMGFGYGTKINEYRFPPGVLPDVGDRGRCEFVTEKELAPLNACYHRVAERTHGMMRRLKSFRLYLARPELRVVACRRRGKITGFIVFEFHPAGSDNWLANEIHISELIYEDRDAFAALIAFLRSQADQIGTIVYRTHDEFFHFVPEDPRTTAHNVIFPVEHETNAQGIGIMYRIIDTAALFASLQRHDFNGGSLALHVSVHDSFLPRHQKGFLIDFDKGHPQVRSRGHADVEIALDVADWSSLVMGVIPFSALYQYGLAEISDVRWIERVTKLFVAQMKPHCVTQF